MYVSENLIFEPVTEENSHLLNNISITAEQKAFFDGETDLVNVAKATIEGRLVMPFIVIDGKDAIGFFRLILSPAKEICSLSAFVISINYQGKGFGTKSLSKIIEKVQADFPAVSCLGLNVHSENIAAINLYKKHGFACTGKWHDDSDIMQKCFL